MRLKAPGYKGGGEVPTTPSPFSNDTTTIKINDTRKIRATTGKPINPNRDLETGRYRQDVIDSLARTAIANHIDPYRMIAMGMQETNLGKTDSFIGHTLYGNRAKSEYQQMADAIIDRDAVAKRLGKTKIEDIYQAYNGYKPLGPNTEKEYYGHTNKAFYGIPVSKGHNIDTNKNPVYGKEILDIQKNIIEKNKNIKDIVNKYQAPIGFKYTGRENERHPFFPIGLKKGGGIYIKPSKRGTFTSAATKHGKSVQGFAAQVLANKSNYSPAMVKKANFARNAAKWHHKDGGMLKYAQGGSNQSEVIPQVTGQSQNQGYDYTANQAWSDASNYVTMGGLAMSSMGNPIGVPVSMAGGIMDAVGAQTKAIKQAIDPNTDVDWTDYALTTGAGLLTTATGGFSNWGKLGKYIKPTEKAKQTFKFK